MAKKAGSKRGKPAQRSAAPKRSKPPEARAKRPPQTEAFESDSSDVPF